MFRLIGGAGRCGKTTLARQAESLYTGQLISLDNLRLAFISLASGTLHATLSASPEIAEETPDEWLSALRERDCIAWAGTKAYLEAAAQKNDDVLMEGILWPDHVAELEVAHRAVFLIDTSPSQADRLVTAARSQSTHNNWMSEQNEEWIRKWATYNAKRSRLYKQLAHEHGQTVFDVADMGVAQAQAAALAHLFPANTN